MNQYSTLSNIPKTARGRKTLEKLLAAAEAEFGAKGFYSVGIGDITREAGVALGTFYVYFESKEEIFRNLVRFISHRTRSWIAKKIVDAPDRLSAERMGLEAYINYARKHPGLYRIISESEFVAPDAFVEHYTKFADAYQENLKSAASRKEIAEGDYEVWSWAILGMGVLLGMRYANWQSDRDASDIAETVMQMISSGIGRP